MNSKIKEYREEAIKLMISDIKYMNKNDVPPDEMFDNMNVKDYSYYATEEDKIKAFQQAGFTVEIN